MKQVLIFNLILILFTLTSRAQVGSDQPPEPEFLCTEQQITDAPFYVSDEYRQGDRIWENFRKIEDDKAIDKYIPRGSIVYTPEEFIGMEGSSGRVPVKVLSVPPKEIEYRVRNSKSDRRYSIEDTVADTKSLKGINRKRVKVNDVGWIGNDSLRKAKNHTFFVTKDAPIFKSPSGHIINDKAISLSYSEEGYDILRCCTPDTYDGPLVCFDRYKYLLKSLTGVKLESFYIKKLECSFIQNLSPVSNNVITPIKSILNLMRVQNPNFAIDELELLPSYQNWSGTTPKIERSEMIKMNYDDQTGKGHYNSFHYRTDDKQNSDSYMKPNSQCALLQVLKKHNEDCFSKGCQVQLGDMYHHDSWGAHQGHDSGECVDIRPFRKNDNDDAGLSYKNTGRYDGTKTKNFIGLLRKAGAREIIFNDKNITASRLSNHDNHIHVCFGENRSKVKETCRNGVPE
jgi:hypothetical protein